MSSKHSLMQRRDFLLGSAASFALLVNHGAGAAIGRGVSVAGVGGGGGGGSVQVATLTLVNTSGSSQAANFVSPIFGHGFKKGDIPTGTAPIFQISGVTQSYSWGCQAYYSDGSLRFASFMLRCTASMAGSATQAVGVFNGGTAPSASARTTTEVYNELVQVNLTGAADGSLSGVWNAVLANNANNHTPSGYVYLDGQAGKVWRFETEFVQSGSAHGQLFCYHYIAALQDVSGNLGGFRYLSRICQPWWNNDTPTKNWRACNSITWQHGAGPTTVNLNWPFSAANFTTAGTATATVASAGTHNFKCGAADNVNLIPGIVTGLAGTTGLTANNIYWAITSSSTTTFQLSRSTDGGGAITFGTGSGTFTPIPTVLHFGSIFTGDVNAKWTFFQGAGSLAADGTIRTQYDRTYIHSTGLIPPYDLSKTGSSVGGTINDTSWGFNWNPVSVGPLSAASRGNTGSLIDLGPLTGFATRHFYNQTAVSELVNRAVAYCSNYDASQCFRDVTTRQITNVGNSAYTGMAAASATQQGLFVVNGSFSLGTFAAPSNGTYYLQGEDNPSHKPSFTYYAYLIFGEPQFLDLLLENNGLIGFPASHRNVTYPTTGFGILSDGDGSGNVRSCAWACRDLQHAATLAPSAHPDGSQVCNYTRDMADASANWPADTFALATAGYRLSSYAVTNGLWMPISANAVNQTDASGSGFQGYYFTMMMCIAAARENTKALTHLNHVSTWYQHLLSAFGGWHMYTEYAHQGNLGGAGNDLTNTDAIADDAHWGAPMAAPTISWTSGNAVFTIGATSGGFVPADGDKWLFDASETLPGNFSAETPYYAINTSGLTFKLTTVLGNAGNIVTPNTSGTATLNSGFSGGYSGPWLVAVSPPAASTGQTPNGAPGPDSYLTYGNAMFNWMSAIGATGTSGLVVDSHARVAGVSGGAGVDYTTFPNWLTQSSL